MLQTQRLRSSHSSGQKRGGVFCVCRLPKAGTSRIFMLTDDRKPQLRTLTPFPSRIAAVRLIFDNETIDYVLHERLEQLLLLSSVTLAGSSFQVPSTGGRSKFAEQLLSLKKVTKLCIVNATRYCSPVDFVYRSTLSTTLTTLTLTSVSSLSADNPRLFRAATYCAQLRIFELLFKDGGEASLNPWLFYMLLCSEHPFSTLTVGAFCCKRMQAAAFHRTLNDRTKHHLELCQYMALETKQLKLPIVFRSQS